MLSSSFLAVRLERFCYLFSVIGSVGNSEHNLQVSGKRVHAVWSSSTHGVVMNPVDHPMGGGEGRSSGGHPRSRNGIPATQTRKPRNKSLSTLLNAEEIDMARSLKNPVCPLTS